MDQLDPSRVHAELSKDKELAKGGFSLVYQGELDGRPVAIKMARADEDELKREISVLHRLHHANVVQLYGTCARAGKLLEVLELCGRGSLEGVVRNELVTQQVWRRYTMAMDLMAGMCYLHGQRVYHGDIKLANVLVSEDYRCKVSDFNLSKFIPSGTEAFRARGGTKLYLSPELQQGKDASFASDIYSLGLCLFELLTLGDYAKLVLEMGGRDLLRWLKDGRMQVQLEGWPVEFAPLQEIVDTCRAYSPTQRPSASNIFAAFKSLDPCASEVTAGELAVQSGTMTISVSPASSSSSSSSASPLPLPGSQILPACRSERVQAQPQLQVGQFAVITDCSHPGSGCVVVLRQWHVGHKKWLVQGGPRQKAWLPSWALQPVRNLRPPGFRLQRFGPHPAQHRVSSNPTRKRLLADSSAANSAGQCKIEELSDSQSCDDQLETIVEEPSEDEGDESQGLRSQDDDAVDDGCDASSELSHVSTHSQFNAANVPLEDWSSDNECHDQNLACTLGLGVTPIPRSLAQC